MRKEEKRETEEKINKLRLMELGIGREKISKLRMCGLKLTKKSDIYKKQ
jgi:hypothetical protein